MRAQDVVGKTVSGIRQYRFTSQDGSIEYGLSEIELGDVRLTFSVYELEADYAVVPTVRARERCDKCGAWKRKD